VHLSFAGRRAFVTGAGHGIGRAIARCLQSAEAQVIGADIRDHREGGVDPRDSSITFVRADLTRKSEVESLVATHGPFDILVHAAGGVCGQIGQPLETVSEADFQAIVAINLTAAFFLAQAVVPAMKRNRYGRIILISSGAGLGVSLTGIQAYAAAKAGEIGLTRQLAHELGQFGITVNGVAPGFIRSNPTTERQWESLGEAGQRELVQRIAMRRLGDVDDIAAVTLFLSSGHAGWITGQTLAVDGGK
jgi:3-oxoacyl-[acyl-carrier protein] reductase